MTESELEELKAITTLRRPKYDFKINGLNGHERMAERRRIRKQLRKLDKEFALRKARQELPVPETEAD